MSQVLGSPSRAVNGCRLNLLPDEFQPSHAVGGHVRPIPGFRKRGEHHDGYAKAMAREIAGQIMGILKASLTVPGSVRHLCVTVAGKMWKHGSNFEGHLLSRQLQPDRLALVQFHVVVPGVQLDAATEGQGGYLRNVRDL